MKNSICNGLMCLIKKIQGTKLYPLIDGNKKLLFEINKNYLIYSMTGSGKTMRIEELLSSDKHIPTILISLDCDFKDVKLNKHCLDFVDISIIEKDIKLGNSIHLTFSFENKYNSDKAKENLIEIYKILTTLNAQHYRLIINEFNYFSEYFFKSLKDLNLSLRKNIIITMAYVSSFTEFNNFIDEIYLGHSCDERLVDDVLNTVNYINKTNINSYYKIDFKTFLKDCLKK